MKSTYSEKRHSRLKKNSRREIEQVEPLDL